MKKMIEHIRLKPLEERKRYARYFATFFTLLIVIAWILLSVFFGKRDTERAYDIGSLKKEFLEISEQHKNIGVHPDEFSRESITSLSSSELEEEKIQEEPLKEESIEDFPLEDNKKEL